ncbi:hypothetical protein ACOSP7_031972 [Xanthoceras sorbifolium]
MIQDSMQSTLPGAISSVFSVAGLSGKGIKSTPWFLDSAAFNHMTNQKHAFVDLKPCSLHQSVTTANGRKLPIQGVGTVRLSNNSTKSIWLPNTFYVPRLIANLISVGQLTDHNCLVQFSSHGCDVQDLQTGQVIMKGHKHGCLFHLNLDQKKSPPFCLTVISSTST